MKNVIVASFKEESKAIEALHKLIELDSFGDIIIYDHIMVRKNADGKTEILKEDDSEGWRTLTGMGVGSLLGLLGGPVGFVIGLYTGTAIGAIADASYYDFAEDFIAKIEKKIAVGTVTIIAEIEEDSEVFADSYLKPFGAVISRSDVDLEFDKHVDDQIDDIETEIAEERAAMKEAVGNEKKKIGTKITDLKEKRRAKIAEFVAKGKQVQNDIKTNAVSGVSKVKADIESVGNNISEKVKKEKLERINRRIGRHENTLNELKTKLNELKD
ncbi:MAG: hypothetical protein ACXWCZ_11510 [Flavisolibacter sp.]